MTWPEKVIAISGWVTFTRQVKVPKASVIDWDQDELYDVSARVSSLNDGYALLIGSGLYESSEFREQSLGGLLIGSAIMIVMSLVIGVVLGRNVLSSVSNINATLTDIMKGDLSRRVSSRHQRDEYGQLAHSINQMLNRIEQLIQGLRDVTVNVSHDLRTPLHRLRGRLELLLVSDDVQDEKFRTAVETGVEEIDGILVTFSELLSIAEAEAGAYIASFEDVDVTALVERVADLYTAPADDQGLQLESCIRPDITLHGKEHLLAQAISNLLENAIKYTPRGGVIKIQLCEISGGFDLLDTH